MPVIELADVRARIGDTEILHRVDLSMEAGEIYGFLGPNGAGKSTTIAVMTGLIPASGGKVAVLGADPAIDAPAIHAACGVLPEQSGFYEWMGARDYLGLFARFHRRDLSDREIGERLAQVGLAPGRGGPIGSFSRGMKQRLGLARSLINDPRLLILDEPTNGLDPRGRRDIHDLLIRLSEDSDVGILMCTHLLDDVDRLCHRVGIISEGQTLLESDLGGLATCAEVSPSYRLHLAGSVPEGCLPEGVRVLSRAGEWLRVEIPASADAAEVWRSLLLQGWPIVEIRREGGGLEELYLSLTEGRPT